MTLCNHTFTNYSLNFIIYIVDFILYTELKISEFNQEKNVKCIGLLL